MQITLEDYYFSPVLKWTLLASSIAITAYVMVKTEQQLFGAFVLLPGIIAISTKYELTINTNKRVIKDAFKFLWITTTAEIHVYRTLNNIMTERERNVYTTNSRGRSGHADFYEYVAYLNYNDDQSVEILRKIDHDIFSAKLESIVSALNITVLRKE
ncbi:hypothetical protein FNH22_07010 [Fulvivirga sp. M361]|uniref:hypothetical protein n=1 Tax=Fulvivirga sp. M361 TaxID=2594266 RepID=UPI00117A2F47|nr:hypothetical protein [Fulvivirga sp. M361]TRX60783.1 hypothetical protein FNH22_07010 [Fulvivirga sp. M361]